MADTKSKFAGMFTRAPEPEAEPPQERTELPPAAAPERDSRAAAPRVAQPVGRPAGKRSDPEWKQFSVLLRRDTQREAADIRRAKGEGDFSALVQTLLDKWVKEQKRKQ